MKPLFALIVAALLPFSALAQETADFAPVPASEVVLNDLMFLKRPLVVFADSPNDPNFIRQMDLIGRDPAALLARDVVVIVDTDPAARSELRKKLRPRGFSLVILDKDLKTTLRKPLPWDVREITHAIDKFPLRRQEIQQGNRPAAGG
ncbi:MAG: methylmalonyl-CoA epimerase [Rhodobacter sp.]|nr:methylmalonyl-CoA epimerase [Rhodobacter sp.]